MKTRIYAAPAVKGLIYVRLYKMKYRATQWELVISYIICWMSTTVSGVFMWISSEIWNLNEIQMQIQWLLERSSTCLVTMVNIYHMFEWLITYMVTMKIIYQLLCTMPKSEISSESLQRHCCTRSYHAVPCYTRLYHVIPGYAMLYQVMPCYARLRHVVLEKIFHYKLRSTNRGSW